MSTSDGSVRICPAPFSSLEAGRGEFVPCCREWLSKEYLALDPGQDLWNGPQAFKLRESILSGAYTYCDLGRCQAAFSTIGELEREVFEEGNGQITARNLKAMLSGEVELADGPTQVIVYSDTRCNLACPSCRTGPVFGIDEARARKLTETEKFLARHGHQIRTVKLASDGEVFFSPWLRATLKSCTKERFPRLQQVNLLSNGLLFDERAMSDLRPGTDWISQVHISVDAGERATYETVRGGDWDRLIRNLEWMSDQRSRGRFRHFQLNFVVQRANFRSIPPFIDLGSRLGADLLFTDLREWTGAGIGDFEREAVHRPSHPEHEEYREIMRSARTPRCRLTRELDPDGVP